MIRFDVAPRPESTLLAQGILSCEERDDLFGKTLRIIGNPNAILFRRRDSFEGL
jgi:hypothetical protein